MSSDICPECGAREIEHDFEHLAKICQPKKIDRLQQKFERLKQAVFEDAQIALEDRDREYAALEANSDEKGYLSIADVYAEKRKGMQEGASVYRLKLSKALKEIENEGEK